jgi:hypothetical protein
MSDVDVSTKEGLLGTGLAAMFTAIGWLARQLFAAPRQAELDQVIRDREAWRAIVMASADENRQKLGDYELELQRLRDELAAARAGRKA